MSTPGPKTPQTAISRRRALSTAAGAAACVGLSGLFLTMMAQRARSMPATAIRPPGALDEDSFLGACVHCGLCARDCPYDILHLSGLGEAVAVGTPYFVAREAPCEMCDDIPCLAACPTGALDPALENIDDARMGKAVIVSTDTCLNYLGLRCDVCYRVCPLIDEAITLEMSHNPRTGKHALFIPTIHSDKCTGCGKCEKSCVLGESAIKVLPLEIAQGSHDPHYRLGWEEKTKKGGPLVEGLFDMPDRLPAAPLEGGAP